MEVRGWRARGRSAQEKGADRVTATALPMPLDNNCKGATGKGGGLVYVGWFEVFASEVLDIV